ncbi:MAG: metal transporter [Acidobacteriota bacterium]
MTYKTILLGLIPLLLLAAVIGALLRKGPVALFDSDLPPIEELHVLRHSLARDVMHLDIVNSGRDLSTVAQVMVRGAFWYHEVAPKRTLEPLETARVTIPFPWNKGEPVEIVLVTATGLTFDYEIGIAAVTPQPNAAAVGRFAMLGIYIGVVPVFLGIAWFPFLRRLGRGGVGFLLYFTVGLLAFLVVDAVGEGLEVSNRLPEVYHGTALLILGLIGTFLILAGVQARGMEKAGEGILATRVAWLIALGIGLHNLGEGLAVGSAYVLGELTLGALLIVGFTLHNATEGIAIVAPQLREKPQINRLLGMGLLAGGPTILGCWIGAFTYSQIWSLLFLGIGSGAILQVIILIIGKRPAAESLAPLNLFGLFAGYLLMYGTGLIVSTA